MKYTYSDENIKELKKVTTELLQKEVTDTSLITNELIMFIATDTYNMTKALNKVRSLIIPNKFANDDLLLYLDTFHHIISSNVMNTYFFKEIYPKLNKYTIDNKLYKLMKTIKYNGENKFNDFLGNLGICTIIIGYIYANNINDYSMLDNFLNDTEYYYQKMKLSGIEFIETELHEFYLIDYHAIYEQTENLFNNKKDKIYIK